MYVCHIWDDVVCWVWMVLGPSLDRPDRDHTG
jgi:hypothetical protein